MQFDPRAIQDALYNLSPDNGNQTDANYCRGVLVGIVSALLSTGMDFEAALWLASVNAPRTVVYNSVPHSWTEAFGIPDASAASYKVNGCKVWERTEGR